MHFLRYEIIRTSKKISIGLELTMHVLKSQIHLVRQSI
jgi:hypothetical protein